MRRIINKSLFILLMTFMILASYDQFSKEENGAYLPKVMDFLSGYSIKNYLDEEFFGEEKTISQKYQQALQTAPTRCIICKNLSYFWDIFILDYKNL